MLGNGDVDCAVVQGKRNSETGGSRVADYFRG